MYAYLVDLTLARRCHASFSSSLHLRQHLQHSELHNHVCLTSALLSIDV